MEAFSDMAYDFGACHEYTRTNGCVSGHNMEKLNDITLEECQYYCSHTPGCLGVEYFRPSAAVNRQTSYKVGDCNLSSGLDTNGCDANKW